MNEEKNLLKSTLTLNSTQGVVEIPSNTHQLTLIYFYPKDDTPGCTQQAQEFNKYLKIFEDLSTKIIGISKDNEQSHEKFSKKYNLKFPLIADIEKTLCNKFNVLKEKSMFGKKYLGIERSTFIIQQNKTIFKVWRKVKVSNHVEQIISFLKTQ